MEYYGVGEVVTLQLKTMPLLVKVCDSSCVYRKRSVLVSNVPAIVGAVVSVLCVRFEMPELLMIGRFFTGINCGTSV